jgi:hypothetical protein
MVQKSVCHANSSMMTKDTDKLGRRSKRNREHPPMMRSRALPEGFDMLSALHCPFGYAQVAGSTLSPSNSQLSSSNLALTPREAEDQMSHRSPEAARQAAHLGQTGRVAQEFQMQHAASLKTAAPSKSTYNMPGMQQQLQFPSKWKFAVMTDPGGQSMVSNTSQQTAVQMQSEVQVQQAQSAPQLCQPNKVGNMVLLADSLPEPGAPPYEKAEREDDFDEKIAKHIRKEEEQLPKTRFTELEKMLREWTMVYAN